MSAKPNASPANPESPGAGVPPLHSSIQRAVAALGDAPLTEAALLRHIHPLFSRVLARKEIYLANHSLGRPLDQTALDVSRAIDLWYTDMDAAWHAWMQEQELFRCRIAELIGLSTRDSTGAPPIIPKPGAGQALRAVINALPNPRPHIVATRGEFDSIDFILKTYHERGRASVRFIDHDGHGTFHADQIIDHLDDSVDLVVISHVFFSTAQVLDGVERVIEAAHDCNALACLDLYHSAGVLPGDFDEIEPDFAIGGSYKYTRGGPGAGWLAIHPKHLDSTAADKRTLPTLDTGWFAKRDVFDFARSQIASEDLAHGAHSWMECTPVILTPYQANAGLELTLALGVERLRAYSLQQQSLLTNLLSKARIPVRHVEPRGAFLLLPHDRAPDMVDALKRVGVNTDARTTPDARRCVRVCPDILNTNAELARAVDLIASVWRAR
jgi:kynureninase